MNSKRNHGLDMSQLLEPSRYAENKFDKTVTFEKGCQHQVVSILDVCWKCI